MFRAALEELKREVLACGGRVIFSALSDSESSHARYTLCYRPDEFEPIDTTTPATEHLTLYKRLYWFERIFQYCLANSPTDAERLMKPLLNAQDAFLESRLVLTVDWCDDDEI